MSQKKRLFARRAALAATTALSLSALAMTGGVGLGSVELQKIGAPKAEAAESVTVLKRGHIDAFNVGADGDGLNLQLKEDATGHHVKRDPNAVELCVTKDSLEPRTEGLDFIGKQAYYLPQSSDGSKTIWPGWDTSDVRGSGAKAVDITITELQGPGEVYLWQDQGLGSATAVTGDYQLRAGAKINVPSPAHVHANWAFTTPGRYTMQVQATADNGARSDAKNYYWTVEGDGVSCGDEVGQHPQVSTGGNGDSGSNAKNGGFTGGASGQGAAGNNTGDTGRKTGAGKTGITKSSAARASKNSSGSTRNSGIVSGISGVSQKSAGKGTSSGGAPTCKKGEPALRARIKDDRQSPPVWRNPSSLIFGLGGSAKAEVPQSLGPINRGTVWMIGSTQQNGVPWLGANTMHPDLLAKTSGDVTFSLTSFSGPGSMFVYEQGNLGQIVGAKWFQASGGKTTGSHTVPRNSHVHPNWVFDKPGTYKVGITQTATMKNGKKVSAPAVLTFKVGGAGNANSGHFDFGADVTTSGDCDAGGSANGGSAGAAGTGGAGGDSASAAGSNAGGSGSSADALANTGMANGTLPLLIVGLGITAFGAGMIYYLRSSQLMSRAYVRR